MPKTKTPKNKSLSTAIKRGKKRARLLAARAALADSVAGFSSARDDDPSGWQYIGGVHTSQPVQTIQPQRSLERRTEFVVETPAGVKVSFSVEERS